MYKTVLVIRKIRQRSAGPIRQGDRQGSLLCGGVAHSSVQPSLSMLTMRAPSMTKPGTKTWMPPSPLPLFSLSTMRDLAVGMVPLAGKQDEGGQHHRCRCRSAFRSRPKSGIFRSRSKSGKCSPDQEAIVPIVETLVLFPYRKASKHDTGVAKPPSRYMLLLLIGRRRVLLPVVRRRGCATRTYQDSPGQEFCFTSLLKAVFLPILGRCGRYFSSCEGTSFGFYFLMPEGSFKSKLLVRLSIWSLCDGIGPCIHPIDVFGYDKIYKCRRSQSEIRLI